jgi:polyphosphate kinase
MHRNLDRRVEVLCRVIDPTATAHLRMCLDAAFAADTAAWELQPDGHWVRSGGDKQVDYQEMLMKRLGGRGD